LISISKLDRDGFSCTFGNNRCVTRCDGDLICYAPLYNELYLLSLSNIFVMNVSDINHKRKRGNETSAKFGHSRPVHISKGRMERLIREEIFPKLDFSDLEQCVDCIKRNLQNKLKRMELSAIQDY